MSTYLQGLGQAVGFAGDNEGVDPPPAPRDNKWDMVSHHSRSQGAVNLLHQARGNQAKGGTTGPTITITIMPPPYRSVNTWGGGLGSPGGGLRGQGRGLRGIPGGGGGMGSAITTMRAPPTNGRGNTRGGNWGAQGGGARGQGGGPGGIPRDIHNDDALDIQSNLSMGEGFNQGGVGGDKVNNWQETCRGGDSRPKSRLQRLAMTKPLSRENLIGRPGSRGMGTKPLLSANRRWGNTPFVRLHS
jgi:hypothetical protein